MFVLEPIPVTRLHEVWPYVRKGLERILEKTGVTDDWWPEDIYAALRYQQATLYLAWHNRQRVGATILQPQTNPHSGKQKLLIWTAHLEDPDAFDLALQEIEHIALSMGGLPVRLTSPRVGWFRKMERRGYRPVEFTFEKEIV